MAVRISEELFIETLNSIKEGYGRIKQFDKALTSISDSFFICNAGEEWLNALIKLLEDVMNDHPTPKYDSHISWWLFDDVEKKLWWEENGEKVELDLTTPEALYKYLSERKVD